MNLEIVKGLLENLNRQSRELINLVIGLQKGEVFGEPLDVTLKAKLSAQAKTRYDAFKVTFDSLTAEVNK